MTAYFSLNFENFLRIHVILGSHQSLGLPAVYGTVWMLESSLPSNEERATSTLMRGFPEHLYKYSSVKSPIDSGGFFCAFFMTVEADLP
jgi:hypothetical protein